MFVPFQIFLSLMANFSLFVVVQSVGLPGSIMPEVEKEMPVGNTEKSMFGK